MKIADKVTVSMGAVGNKIRLNSQGWEDVRVLNERQVFMVVALKGSSISCPSIGQPSSSTSTTMVWLKLGSGPTTVNSNDVAD